MQTLFRQATRHHEAGNLDDAEQAYRAVLARDPDHADTLHGLGVLLHARGRSDLAIGFIGRALRLKPRQAHYHVNLGQALLARDHVEEARAAFAVAVLLDPQDPLAPFNAAVALKRLGRLAEARAAYAASLRLAPAFSEAWANLGVMQFEAGDLEGAAASLRTLVDLRPADGPAHGILGTVLLAQALPAAAEAPLAQAAALAPDNHAWPGLLGAALIRSGRAGLAEAPLRAALALAPDDAESRNNLGLALLALGRPAEAAAELTQALDRKPDSADIRNNLGTALRDDGRPDSALAAWQEALEYDRNHPSAHFNIATRLLATGDFAAGWQEFEWRLRVPGAIGRDFRQPRWTGGDLAGGTLLIHAEQGFGDTIQFCRFAALAARDARIVLEVPRPLRRLLDASGLAGTVVAHGDRLPAFDAHVPLLSLPGILGTTLDTIPAAAGYLTAVAPKAWRERMAALPGPRVGLCWAGSHAYSHDRLRSLEPADLAPLAATGVSLVSLQLGQAPPAGLPLQDWRSDLTDFADTADLIAGLDLVISVDTAVAHLAAALGRPTWLLNRFDADWRWLRDRDDSPWYATLRQFRQTRAGDWTDVIARVSEALRQRSFQQ